MVQIPPPQPKRKAPLAGAFLFGSEMRLEPRAHPGCRREWAWSATAAGGVSEPPRRRRTFSISTFHSSLFMHHPCVVKTARATAGRPYMNRTRRNRAPIPGDGGRKLPIFNSPSFYKLKSLFAPVAPKCSPVFCHTATAEE